MERVCLEPSGLTHEIEISMSTFPLSTDDTLTELGKGLQAMTSLTILCLSIKKHPRWCLNTKPTKNIIEFVGNYVATLLHLIHLHLSLKGIIAQSINQLDLGALGFALGKLNAGVIVR